MTEGTTPYPTTYRRQRTEMNKERYGSMPERGEIVLQALAAGPLTSRALSDSLHWPPGITGGVLRYLQQQRKVVRHSGGRTTWELRG